MTPEFFGLNLTVEIKGRKKSTKQKPLAQPCGSRGPRTAGLPAQGGMRLVEKAQGERARVGLHTGQGPHPALQGDTVLWSAPPQASALAEQGLLLSQTSARAGPGDRMGGGSLPPHPGPGRKLQGP